MKVMRSPETAVHFVTLLEEMPVQETVDGIADLRDIGLPVGGLMVNMVRPPILPDSELTAALEGELDVEAIRMGIKAAGLEDNAAEIAQALATEASDHARRASLQERELARLTDAEVPQYELPLLSDGMDLAGLYEFAEEFRKQGAA
jgi:hypothetical protein